MTTWDVIKRAQPLADEHGFGADWRTFVETKDLEAAARASYALYRLWIGSDDEEAEDLGALWTDLTDCIAGIKRRQNRVAVG